VKLGSKTSQNPPIYCESFQKIPLWADFSKTTDCQIRPQNYLIKKFKLTLLSSTTCVHINIISKTFIRMQNKGIKREK
jgi:hypothetical protein